MFRWIFTLQYRLGLVPRRRCSGSLDLRTNSTCVDDDDSILCSGDAEAEPLKLRRIRKRDIAACVVRQADRGDQGFVQDIEVLLERQLHGELRVGRRKDGKSAKTKEEEAKQLDFLTGGVWETVRNPRDSFM